MNIVFADTCYWIAVTNPNDYHHAAAKDSHKALGQFRIVTSEMVLVEFMNSLSGKGDKIRETAIKVVETIMNDQSIEVFPQTSKQFRESIGRYKKFQDKEWSLTDCASMQIMEEKKIKGVLTNDHHFEQAGFSALMRG